MSLRPAALITGASAGIGLELARVCARHGHPLVLVARRRERLEKLARELEQAHGVTVTVRAADLAAAGVARELAEELLADGPEIGMLVNNAGFGALGPFHELDLERQLQMVDLNVCALTELTHRFLPSMVARGSGRILNVASTAAFQPGPWMSTYYATKSYVLHFSEGVAGELRGTGVTVSTLCPGPTATEFSDVAGVEESFIIRRVRMTAVRVAEAGYRGCMRGRAVITPGIFNKAGAFMVRCAPRALVRRLLNHVQSRMRKPATGEGGAS